MQGHVYNGGRVSATITIVRERAPIGPITVTGKVRQDDFLAFDVDVPRGTQTAIFETSWMQNWSRYPTNDIDMYLVDPGGVSLDAGVSINSPERVFVESPAAGRWRVVIHGYEVFRPDGRLDDPDQMRGRVDDFTLRVTADGRTLKPARRACPGSCGTR